MNNEELNCIATIFAIQFLYININNIAAMHNTKEYRKEICL